MSMTKAETVGLQTLVQRQLSSVEFVQDYVQLRFDGPCLTAITGPTVTSDGATVAWGAPGFRDRLCGRIGRTVCSVDIEAEHVIAIGLDDGSIVSISLAPEDYRGPEAAVFTAGADGTWVW